MNITIVCCLLGLMVVLLLLFFYLMKNSWHWRLNIGKKKYRSISFEEMGGDEFASDEYKIPLLRYELNSSSNYERNRDFLQKSFSLHTPTHAHRSCAKEDSRVVKAIRLESGNISGKIKIYISPDNTPQRKKDIGKK